MNLFNNLLGGHCLWSTRTRCITGGKITTFKVGHPVFDGGACSPNVSVRMALISFGALSEKKRVDRSHLDVGEIARVA